MPVLEISDLIAAWDPVTRVRQPIVAADVAARLRAAGDARAARIVERIPVSADGLLTPEAVDRLFVRAHTELQRLAEELHMARRFAAILGPLLAAARSAGYRKPRVVDIGCGIGYVIRFLAAGGILGTDVELVGVDLNPVLIQEAARLAADEELRCQFLRADAFALPEDATVYISSGVAHHFPDEALPAFFRAQDRPGTAGFVHYDIAATRLGPFGAWLFHRVRMREPFGRHDGVASARRAHDDRTLICAARAAAGMDVFLFERVRYTNPFCASMRPVVGIRPELVADLRRELGSRAGKLIAGDAVTDRSADGPGASSGSSPGPGSAHRR